MAGGFSLEAVPKRVSGSASPASAAHGIADEIWAVLQSIDGNRRRTYDAIRAAQAQLFAHTEEYFLRVGETLTRG